MFSCSGCLLVTQTHLGLVGLLVFDRISAHPLSRKHAGKRNGPNGYLGKPPCTISCILTALVFENIGRGLRVILMMLMSLERLSHCSLEAR
ncbi:hypothetical protein K458DRAFT_422016 [Lentithecium fluviatile CBS 122367]|uniref:Secreted protein n=1 Tax=Lentithecium fluviatile CBS 122367 TaxID=1168545 RepID=A0A6G1INL3_9PLEO|nr:hypothetical protein K458DRAFT_422016 [Lentithecium fluviatile CBS 122367]